MFEQVICNAIETTINSFDIAFCLSCNVFIYLVINAINRLKRDNPVEEWEKRVVTFVCIIIMSIIWFIIGTDTKVIINSALITPVCYTWILKPIFKVMKIDYENLVSK